jgi:hypothetical protein
MFVLASQGAKRIGRVVCWTLGTLAPHASRSLLVCTETLLGVTGRLRDAAIAEAIGGGHHLSAHAHADVIVAHTGSCGAAASLGLHIPDGPLAVAAC